jgi:hypothetical protein
MFSANAATRPARGLTPFNEAARPSASTATSRTAALGRKGLMDGIGILLRLLFGPESAGFLSKDRFLGAF